jgi:hypothetical protein
VYTKYIFCMYLKKTLWNSPHIQIESFHTHFPCFFFSTCIK